MVNNISSQNATIKHKTLRAPGMELSTMEKNRREPLEFSGMEFSTTKCYAALWLRKLLELLKLYENPIVLEVEFSTIETLRILRMVQEFSERFKSCLQLSSHNGILYNGIIASVRKLMKRMCLLGCNCIAYF